MNKVAVISIILFLSLSSSKSVSSSEFKKFETGNKIKIIFKDPSISSLSGIFDGFDSDFLRLRSSKSFRIAKIRTKDGYEYKFSSNGAEYDRNAKTFTGTLLDKRTASISLSEIDKLVGEQYKNGKKKLIGINRYKFPQFNKF